MARIRIPVETDNKAFLKADRKHRSHVRKIKRPPKGCLPHAEGHGLRMVTITTVHYECECGEKFE